MERQADSFSSQQFSHSEPVQLGIEPDDSDADDGEDTEEDEAGEDDAGEDDAGEDDADDDDANEDASKGEDVAEGNLEAIQELPTFNPFSNVHPVSSPF